MRLALITRYVIWSAVALAALGAPAHAQNQRAEWNRPQEPVRVFGNTYYVGPHGLSSILITSDAGHVLIDGALPESAAVIVASVKRLGFRIEDVRLILNTHAHDDHAGGIAELQRLSGAKVAATAASARVFEQGRAGPDDPQYGGLRDIGRVSNVQVISDGEVLRVGPIAVTAHRTGGHTAGGTTWTWTSCEASRCLDIVYADSVTAVSADSFRFSDSKTYPTVLDDFEKSFAFLSSVSCDVLLTPHPEASGLWERLAKRDAGGPDALVDRTACRRLADGARAYLQKRLESERRECFAFARLGEETPFVSDAAECAHATAPASTFKIPHALIALETGVITTDTVMTWDGTPRDFESWQRDHTVRSAIQWSVFPFFQRTARLIGEERMRRALSSIAYAADTFAGEVSSFWVNGDLVVSPMEQLAFLQRFYSGTLPIAAAHVAVVKDALRMPAGHIVNASGRHAFHIQWPPETVVSAKTGNGTVKGERVSWLVGAVTASGADYVFVARARSHGSLSLTAGIDVAARGLDARRPG